MSFDKNGNEDCGNCVACFKCSDSFELKNCKGCYDCRNCVDCENCTECRGLSNKRFCFRNVQLTPAQYKSIIVGKP